MTEVNNNVFPIAIGSEEETRFTVMSRGEYAGALTKAVLERTGTSNGQFSANGGKYYNDTKSLEMATPECGDPRTLATHIRANEQLYIVAMVDVLNDYNVPQARIQRRVIGTGALDGDNPTWGHHDNFSDNDLSFAVGRAFDEDLLVAHQVTRGFVTGLGRLSLGNHAFSQKRTFQHGSINKYSFGSSLHTIREGRVEIRDNDINISDWAIRMRVAATAGVLALMHLPAHKNVKIDPKVLTRWPGGPHDYFNQFSVDPDGFMDSNSFHMLAADTQQQIVEELLNADLREDVIPASYKAEFNEYLQYIEDYKRVLRRELPIKVLTDRADWAAKLHSAQRRIMRKNVTGAQNLARALQMQDFKYDGILVNRDGSVAYGTGYILRDKGNFRLTIPAKNVERAMTVPPPGRARARADIILWPPKGLKSVDWGDAKYQGIKNDVIVPMPIDGDYREYDELYET